ncbi:MAG: prolyl oligopeptidase family serine peptidase [Pseudomonadota bacterium]
MSALSGPRRPPATGGAPDCIIVFLHGYGANGEDLLSLSDMFSLVLPGALFVAPDAPQEMGMGGRAWFPLTMRDPSEYARGVAAAGPALERGIEDELDRHGLPEHRLALIGFSQGTMMALHVAYRLRAPVAGVVGFSGLCAGADDGLKAAPTLLVHGTGDQVVPAMLTLEAAQTLAGKGIPVEWHLIAGLGHGIDETGISMAVSHVAQCLKGR